MNESQHERKDIEDAEHIQVQVVDLREFVALQVDKSRQDWMGDQMPQLVTS